MVTEGVGRVSWVFQEGGCVLVVNPFADVEVYDRWLEGARRVVVVVTHYDWGVCGGHHALRALGAEVYLPGEVGGIEWCGWQVEFHSCLEGVEDVVVVGSRSGRVGWIVGGGLLSYPRPLFYLEGRLGGGGRLAEVEKRLGRWVLDLMKRYAIHEEARFFPTVLSFGGGDGGGEGWGQGIPPRYGDWLEVVRGLAEGEVHGSGVLPTVWRRYRVSWNRGEVEEGGSAGRVVRVDMRSGGHVRETGLFPSIPYVSGRWLWEYLPLVVSVPGVGLEVVVEDEGQEVLRQLIRFGFGRERIRLRSYEELVGEEELMPVVVIDVEEFRLDLLFDPYPFYVVDVRPESWYVEGHIRGAEHLPLSELIAGLGEEGGSGLTGREKIYVYGRDVEEALMGWWWLVRLGGGKMPVLRVVDGTVEAFLEKDLPVYKTIDVSR